MRGCGATVHLQQGAAALRQAGDGVVAPATRVPVAPARGPARRIVGVATGLGGWVMFLIKILVHHRGASVLAAVFGLFALVLWDLLTHPVDHRG